MLPPSTAENVRRLLDTLDLLDLADVASTCSGSGVAFDRNSKNDCIRIILNFHSTAGEILGRRKVKREYLIKFLWSCDIPVSLNMNKTEAVERLLNLWQMPVAQGGQLQQQLDLQHQQMQNLQQQQQLNFSQRQLQEQEKQQGCLRQVSPSSPIQDEESAFLFRLSNAFVQWFFAAYHSPAGVPPTAFEAECDFSVELGGPAMPNGRIHRETHRSSQRASQGLVELARNHGYAMQPNISNSGLQAERSSFGLVRVTVDCSLYRLLTADAAASNANYIGLARLHCLLAPRLTAAGGVQQQPLEHNYSIRGLRLLLYLESAGGVPACLMPQLPAPHQLSAIGDGKG